MISHDSPLPPESRRSLEALTHLSKKWSPVVLLTLQHRGPQGFNDLLEGIPDLSSKVLSDTLESLQDAGLIERRVVSESPLRVEYDRTAPGRDMEPIFESLAEWVDSHLESATRTVLLADTDRRITDMYQQWLADRYTVVRAHDTEELADRFDDRIDVALLDSELPGTDFHKTLSGFEQGCRTILIVGDRPDFDVLSVDCDDVLRKPFVRETALEAIESQLSRIDEPVIDRERASVGARQSLFESLYSRDRLEADRTYCALSERLDELEKQCLE